MVLLWLLVIVIANSFLIVRFEFVRSTEFIKFLGSFVYKLLSTEVWKEDPRILKSFTDFASAGGDPSHIPVTVVTPVTIIEFWDTLKTLLYVGTVDPEIVYWTSPPTFTLFVNAKLLSALFKLILLIPVVDLAVIELIQHYILWMEQYLR